MDISEVIAAAVLAVPGVAALHAGAFGQIASYLPGRSVTGIRIRPDVTDVHVVLFWGAPVLATADEVRTVVKPFIGALSARVDVTVDDVVDPLPQPEPGTDSDRGPALVSEAGPITAPGDSSARPPAAGPSSH